MPGTRSHATVSGLFSFAVLSAKADCGSGAVLFSPDAAVWAKLSLRVFVPQAVKATTQTKTSKILKSCFIEMFLSVMLNITAVEEERRR